MTTVPSALPIRRALLSVSDKTGIVDLARALVAAGVDILSTGGTAALLAQSGVAVTEVSAHTGFPEIMDGRVKTLHPGIHGGLLARRDRPEHLQALERHGIAPIDLLVVNLYPFASTVARPDCTVEDGIENIDIGGPAMLRAAAKNHAGVAVVVDPADYPRIIGALTGEATLDEADRRILATKVFAHTARYDGAVAAWLSSLQPDGSRAAFPGVLTLQLEQAQALRYGENPHQSASFYRERNAPAGSLGAARQRQGKELSFNNIADADAAWQCVRGFAEPACVIIKHANPCGVAIAADPLTAYRHAFATDPTSAFGGIVAFNRPVDGATAAAVSTPFVEVVLAPDFDEAALKAFAAKPNVRLLQMGTTAAARPDGAAADAVLNPDAFDWRRIEGGLLVQSVDTEPQGAAALRCVTKQQPGTEQERDLQFAWQVARFVKSNAIVFCAGGRTLGIGAGQMSRVDSARIASIKAQQAGLSLAGSVVASDAFFPFRDGLDVVVDAGATAVVHPGGSMRDAEVIAAADERGVCMVVTGVRHFRH